MIRSHSRSSSAYLPISLPVFSAPDPASFRSLTLHFRLLSLCFFLSALWPFRLTVGSSSRLGFLRPRRFSPSSTAGFPSASSGCAYSVLCSFPFVLPCFAPTAVPQVLPFWISPRGSTLDFRFLSSASALASHYSAHLFFLSTLFPSLPHSWLLRCFCSALASQILPLTPGLVSHAIFPVPCTRLPVCFLSSFPASLPQLFHWCFPFGSLLGDQRLTSTFFRPLPF